jgi:hypothetical protein
VCVMEMEMAAPQSSSLITNSGRRIGAVQSVVTMVAVRSRAAWCRWMWVSPPQWETEGPFYRPNTEARRGASSRAPPLIRCRASRRPSEALGSVPRRAAANSKFESSISSTGGWRTWLCMQKASRR